MTLIVGGKKRARPQSRANISGPSVQSWSDLVERVGDDDVLLTAGGCYETRCMLLDLQQGSRAKEAIMDFPHCDDFADYVLDGNAVKVLDQTRTYGNVFATSDEAKRGEVDHPTFDHLFPRCIPIAVDVDEDEFFFIDTRRPSYPVLFWSHEGLLVAAADLTSFVAQVEEENPDLA